MEDKNTTPDTQGEVSQLNTAPVEGTVGNVAGDAMTLAEINSVLGKNFTTKEAALKSWKDTNSYVGMKIEDIEKRVMSKVQETDKTSAISKELEEMRKERFYDKNPQYSSLRSVIEKTGRNPVEVVNEEWFKEISKKVSGYDESQKLRTVLESNPRLSSSRDSLTKARDISSKHDRPTEEVESLVANAVKDAFGL